MEIAIRRRLERQIIAGPGGTNCPTGIINAPTDVMPADADIELEAIDAVTLALDAIVFGFGGADSVVGGLWLILNKLDLKTLSALRTTNGDRIYTAQLDPRSGSVGTISARENAIPCPFILISALPARRRREQPLCFTGNLKPMSS